MSEYVSRKAVLQKFFERGSGYIDMLTMKIMIDEIPSADVQPVKRGEWISQGDDMWLCSNCRENIIFSMHESDRTEKQRYCCKCGARMGGSIDG